MVQLFPALRSEKTVDYYKSLQVYTKEVISAVTKLRETVHHYCDGSVNLAMESARQVIEQEKKADELRRAIEKKLYTGAIMPFGKEDKFALLEAIDDLADKAEIIVRLAGVSQPVIPKAVSSDIKELANKVELTAKMLEESVAALDIDMAIAIKLATKVELSREIVRELEFKIMTDILKKSKTVNALLLKDLVSLVGRVADNAEDAADRVITLAVKYQG